jgi:PIN domain nuclease of toxin-antitoxin system
VPHDVFFDTAIAGNGFKVLTIEPRHTAAIIGLPKPHKDPFDRLLIAQALSEQTALYTADPQLARYAEIVRVIR